MKSITCALFIVVLAGPAPSADWTLFRRISQVAGCAASMADAKTTFDAARYGAVESNALLGREPSVARVVGIKLGLCVGQFAWSEWQLHQRRRNGEERQAEIVGAVGGLAETGLFSAFAIHNVELANKLKRERAAAAVSP